MSAVSGYCSFFVEDLLLGVLVTDVQEVIRHLPSTRVPLADAVVGGLINLRGQILTTLDLRRRLGLPPRGEGADPPMHVIVRSADGLLSLQVDAVGDVLDVDGAVVEPPPESLRPPLRGLVRGVIKLDRRLLVVLDTERTVHL
jgi:purine-binding chemotaxis protein CheW